MKNKERVIDKNIITILISSLFPIQKKSSTNERERRDTIIDPNITNKASNISDSTITFLSTPLFEKENILARNDQILPGVYLLSSDTPQSNIISLSFRL